MRRSGKKTKTNLLVWGKPGVAAAAAEKLKALYPGIQIAGIQHGYETDNEKVIAKINEAKPDILFVAMGSPKQENWINANRDQLYPTIYQGVGGSFDVLAGNVKRAPKAFQKVGLEWFYRLMMEPKRIKRQMALPKFLLEVVRNTKRN